MKKFLYVVDHYIPFPSSEYGGIWVVIAENDDECFDLITQDDDNFHESYYSNLREKIINARTYEVKENVESQIVESFTT